jgi:pimeloyl-ACP methyl ester carboxylesterase
MSVRFNTVNVDGLDVFYREAGHPSRPAVLLLHGFPSASHMFRDLIPELADHYHVVAPDLPGFGMTEQPPREKFGYTFANITKVIDRFTEALGLKEFVIYVFDYGAPIGFRLAVKHPERINAIVTQNGNTYLEGISEAFAPIQTYWNEPTKANRDALRGFLTPATTLFQYTHGVADLNLVSPDGRNLDDFYLTRPGNDEIQLDLFLDYQSNVAFYDTIQAYLRQHQPPVLAVWGKNDPFFVPPGAEAFKRDVPSADIRFVDSGHFALETHAREIGAAMREFLAKRIGVCTEKLIHSYATREMADLAQ